MKNFIKILSILMVLSMLATVFAACTDKTETPDTDNGTTDTDGTTDTQPGDDEADNGEVIKILNLDSFLLLVAAINKDPSQSIGKTYRLMIDLDIYPGWDATPSEKLGKLIKPDAITEFAGINEFYGTFDGNGKTITGFYMADTAAAGDTVAIFKNLNGGTIKNLTVNSAFIYDDGAKGAIVSGLVGTVTGDNSVIENVTVNSNVYAATDADANVAGVVGKVAAENLTMKNVTFSGRIGVIGADMSINSPSTTATLSQMIVDGGDKTITMTGCKANGAINAGAQTTTDAFCAKGSAKLTKTDCTVTAPTDSGTENSVVEIYTAEELKTLATLGSDFDGKTVKLMNDIVLDKSNTATIAVFKGVLDGNGKIISGFNGECFIGTLNGTVKNLMILDSTFTSANASTLGFIGTVENGTVQDVYSEGKVSYTGSADAKIGGIAGAVSGTSTFENVVFAGVVEANGKTADLIANGTATYKNVLAVGTGATTAVAGTCVLAEKKDAAFLEGNTAYADWSYSAYLSSVAPTTIAELLRFLQLTPDTSWYNDTDTVFEISTPEQFLGLSVLGQTNNFAGKTIKLTANIDLNPTWTVNYTVSSAGNVTYSAAANNVWTPIPVFKGTLDGQGYRVSGIYAPVPFSGAPSSGQKYIGGFVVELIDGAIQNLIVDNSMVLFSATSNFTGTTRLRIGTFVSRAVDSTIKNIYVDMDSWILYNNRYTFGGLVCSIETASSDGNYKGTLEEWVYAGTFGRLVDGNYQAVGVKSSDNINVGVVIGVAPTNAAKVVVRNIAFIGSVYMPSKNEVKQWFWDDSMFSWNTGGNTYIVNDNYTIYHNFPAEKTTGECTLESEGWDMNGNMMSEMLGSTEYQNNTYGDTGFKYITIENGAGITDPIMLPGEVVDMLLANNE